MRAALSDLRVVELAQTVAGRYCGKLFADLGADVVAVEPIGGDAVRRLGGWAAAGSAPAALHYFTNKRSVSPRAGAAAADELWELLADADLVIESRDAGNLADFGISWDSARNRFPRLVIAHLSGFGADGPYADYKSSDLVEQAMSGALLLQHSDQEPLKFPIHLGSCFVGNMAAVASLGALTAVSGGADGTVIDLAAVETLASSPPVASMLLLYQYRGGIEPEPTAARTETLIPTGVFPCADGHVALMSTPQQLQEMLRVLGNADLNAAFARPDAFTRPDTKEYLDAALYPWLFEHTRAEATAIAQAAGWPFAGVNTPAEVLAADHLRQRGFWVHSDDHRFGPVDLPGAPYRFAEGGWQLRRRAPDVGEHNGRVQRVAERAKPPAHSGPGRLPLEGVRVLDLTTVWSGPYATMLLADLGAEVIRIENPFVLPPTTKGYTARPTSTSNLGRFGSGYAPPAPGAPDRPWNRHALNNSSARNKRSVAIDTRRPEGMELLMRLAEKSDVFIENQKAVSMARMGISLERMQRSNPRLIIVRLPPTGLSGDWSPYTGFGAQFDGLTGMLWMCGHRDSELATSPATTYMDAATGPAAAFATMAALRYREHTGRGQLVELAQTENVLNHLGEMYVALQAGIQPERMGNRDPDRAPQGLYAGRPFEGRDRWLAISVGSDAEWGSLAKVIGHPELVRDPRFLTHADRWSHHDELDAVLAEWIAKRDVVEAFHELQVVGVAAAPLMDEPMFSDDPHVRARGWLRPLFTTDVGEHVYPSHPYRGLEQAWWRGSPALGEDNEYVYKTILGVSDEEYASYAEARILAEDYLAPDGTPL